MAPSEEELRKRAQNLMKRLPNASEEDVMSALRDADGHAGHAERQLKRSFEFAEFDGRLARDPKPQPAASTFTAEAGDAAAEVGGVHTAAPAQPDSGIDALNASASVCPLGSQASKLSTASTLGYPIGSRASKLSVASTLGCPLGSQASQTSTMPTSDHPLGLQALEPLAPEEKKIDPPRHKKLVLPPKPKTRLPLLETSLATNVGESLESVVAAQYAPKPTASAVVETSVQGNSCADSAGRTADHCVDELEAAVSDCSLQLPSTTPKPGAGTSNLEAVLQPPEDTQADAAPEEAPLQALSTPGQAADQADHSIPAALATEAITSHGELVPALQQRGLAEEMLADVPQATPPVGQAADQNLAFAAALVDAFAADAFVAVVDAAAMVDGCASDGHAVAAAPMPEAIASHLDAASAVQDSGLTEEAVSSAINQQGKGKGKGKGKSGAPPPRPKGDGKGKINLPPAHLRAPTEAPTLQHMQKKVLDGTQGTFWAGLKPWEANGQGVLECTFVDGEELRQQMVAPPPQAAKQSQQTAPPQKPLPQVRPSPVDIAVKAVKLTPQLVERALLQDLSALSAEQARVLVEEVAPKAADGAVRRSLQKLLENRENGEPTFSTPEKIYLTLQNIPSSEARILMLKHWCSVEEDVAEAGKQVTIAESLFSDLAKSKSLRTILQTVLMVRNILSQQGFSAFKLSSLDSLETERLDRIPNSSTVLTHVVNNLVETHTRMHCWQYRRWLAVCQLLPSSTPRRLVWEYVDEPDTSPFDALPLLRACDPDICDPELPKQLRSDATKMKEVLQHSQVIASDAAAHGVHFNRQLLRLQQSATTALEVYTAGQQRIADVVLGLCRLGGWQSGGVTPSADDWSHARQALGHLQKLGEQLERELERTGRGRRTTATFAPGVRGTACLADLMTSRRATM